MDANEQVPLDLIHLTLAMEVDMQDIIKARTHLLDPRAMGGAPVEFDGPICVERHTSPRPWL